MDYPFFHALWFAARFLRSQRPAEEGFVMTFPDNLPYYNQIIPPPDVQLI